MNIDGVDIFVEQLIGQGNINFILIHNAGGNHQFFIHQLKLLKKYGNVIQLDLPGHGSSAKIPRYQMQDLSSLVSKIIKDLSLKNICLIGLNNGANIVVDTLMNDSLPVSSAILIDPPLFMDKFFIEDIRKFIEVLDEKDISTFVELLVNSLFVRTDSYNKAIATNAFCSVNKKALQEIFKGLIEWNSSGQKFVTKIKCPSLFILTDEHHCSYDKLRQLSPEFDIGKVVGSKCWATLEVPEQVNAMIERFLKIRY